MKAKVNIVKASSYISESKLPASDFVINPYVGCLHGCKYCYARFMKKFTNHDEEWGTFIDVKQCDKPIDIKKLKGKTIFIASVTDCYNPIEKEYQITRRILEQIKDSDAIIDITTKSSLVLRDMDIIKQMKNAEVAISINTLDEKFKADMDNAPSIKERIKTLRTLHENGIRTVLFMSPIFPEITEWQQIVERTKGFVDEYWFENLNLRGDYKIIILEYISKKYPDLVGLYDDIYNRSSKTYWQNLERQIERYCIDNNIKFRNFFYHDEIKKK